MLTIVKTRPDDFQIKKLNFFAAMEIFQNVPAGILREIEKCGVEKRFAKHDSIFLETDPALFVWFVKEGYIKETHHSSDGRKNTLCLVGPQGIFGVAAFEGGLYGFHGVAETDSIVISFPIQHFLLFMERCPALARTVLSKITKLLRHSKDKVVISQESAEKRLLHVLMDLVMEFGGTIPLNRKEIASMAGTSEETCIRTFTRLEEAGLISAERGKITVKNTEHLKTRMEKF